MIAFNFEVSNLLDPFVKGYKLLNDEYNHFFEIGLEEYLQNQTFKYLYTNTFLHRAEKVNFFSIYHPIKVKYNSKIFDFRDIKKTLRNHRYITIVGSAGSGKSTLTKFIFLNCIKESAKIPILIELRNLNDFEENLEKLIINKIINTSIEPSENLAKRTLKNGDFLFLLDGYDEIYTSKKQKVNEQIDSFVDSYSNNNFIITTRPGSGIEGFNRFLNFSVVALSGAEIIEFVNLMVENKERRSRIVSIINDPSNANYIEYLSNPLLLSMFILAFESHPEIPTKKTAFYRNVFDTLYSKHDGITKNSYLREKKTKLQREDFQQILYLFSYLSYVQGHYSFTFEYFTQVMSDVKKRFNLSQLDDDELIYDFETTISIFIKDGFEYKFPHRSMQEYFAAEFVSRLPYEKKELGYAKLLKYTSKRMNDDSLNMWYLCEELDSSALTKFFLIPELTSMRNVLKENNPVKLVKSFFKIIVPSIYFHDENMEIEPNSLKLYRMINFETSLVTFCDFYDFKPYYDFFQDSNSADEFDQYLRTTNRKWRKNVSYHENIIKDDECINLFIKNGMVEVIKNFESVITLKIKQYRQQIKDEVNLIGEVLGF